MWKSSRAAGLRGPLRAVPFGLVFFCVLSTGQNARAVDGQAGNSPSDIVAAAFEDARIERSTHYLTADQHEWAQKMSGDKNIRNVVYAYDAFRDGRRIATAYFDKHRVRNLPQTLMVVITPSNTVERVQVISFTEPRKYMPPPQWYATFRGGSLTPRHKLSPAIHGVTGATLTYRATTRAVKRILAVHQALQGHGP